MNSQERYGPVQERLVAQDRDRDDGRDQDRREHPAERLGQEAVRELRRRPDAQLRWETLRLHLPRTPSSWRRRRWLAGDRFVTGWRTGTPPARRPSPGPRAGRRAGSNTVANAVPGSTPRVPSATARRSARRSDRPGELERGARRRLARDDELAGHLDVAPRGRAAAPRSPPTISAETRVRPSSRRSQASGFVASSAAATNSSRWRRRISDGRSPNSTDSTPSRSLRPSWARASPSAATASSIVP